MASSVGSSSGSGSADNASGSSNSKPPTAAQLLAAAQQAAQAAAQTIISGSGIGQGMNLQALLSGLMSVESVPLLQLEAQQAGVQAEISGFGTITSAMSAFQDAMSDLTVNSSFQTLAAASSDETVASVSLNAGAKAGSYSIDVTQLAQSESLLASGVASSSTAIGSGQSTTLSIELGTTTGSPATFTPTSGQQAVQIKIDSSNNTLEGIRSAINASGAGVTATIVNDGSGTPYRLQITSNSTGATQAIRMSVAGAGGSGTGDSTLTSMFTYDPAGTKGLTEESVAQNAKLTVNSTPIESATNTVDNSFPGLAIDLLGKGSTTVTVGNATNNLETLIDNFVTAYNTMQTTIQPLTAFDPNDATNNGPLIGDSTVQQLESSIQRIVTSSVSGQPSTMEQLADIGITLNPDNGQLQLDSTTLESAISANPNALQGLFATNATATDPLVSVIAQTGSSPQSGTYAVNVTHAATQGSVVGSAPATLPTGTTSLSITLNGTFATVSVPAGPYTTASDYAAALQTAINSNATFSKAGFSTTVSAAADGTLSITSAQYGSTSNVKVGGTDAASIFGSATVNGTAGTDIQGTIGGFPATGSGQTLTAEGTLITSGLSVTVKGTQTGQRGTVSYSNGIASQLANVMNQAIQIQGKNNASADGSITGALKVLSDQVSNLETQESNTQSFIDSTSDNYKAKFTQLQATLASMASIKSYLQQIFNPSTSG